MSVTLVGSSLPQLYGFGIILIIILDHGSIPDSFVFLSERDLVHKKYCNDYDKLFHLFVAALYPIRLRRFYIV